MNDQRRVFWIVVGLNLLWAPVNQMISWARSTGFSPLGIGLTRWVCLASLLTLLLLTSKFREFTGYKSMSRTDWLKSFVIGILFFGPSHLLYYSSMDFTTELEGSVILSTNPVWVAIISYFILKEEAMSPKRWAAIILTFVGAYIVTVGFHVPNMVGHSKGNLMFFVGVLFESLMGVMAVRISRRASGVSVLCGQMWGGATAFMLATLFLPSQLPLAIPAFSIASFAPLLYLIFISGILTFTTWYRIVEKSQLTLLVVLIGLQPPISALISWFVSHKVPTNNAVVGALIIISALFVGFVGEKPGLQQSLDPPGPAG